MVYTGGKKKKNVSIRTYENVRFFFFFFCSFLRAHRRRRLYSSTGRSMRLITRRSSPLIFLLLRFRVYAVLDNDGLLSLKFRFLCFTFLLCASSIRRGTFVNEAVILFGRDGRATRKKRTARTIIFLIYFFFLIFRVFFSAYFIHRDRGNFQRFFFFHELHFS